MLDEEYSSLYEDGQQQRLADALESHFGKSCTVAITVAAITGETPRMYSERKRAERVASAVQAMHDDPLVKDLTELFNGRLLEETVQPVE